MTSEPRQSQYSPKAVAYLLENWRALRPQVTDLLITLWQLSATAPTGAKDQLTQGVGRRLDTMLVTADAVFTLIPPARTKVSRDVIKRATINLQAFLIHTVGVMDNMAWAYLHWHGLQSQINRNHVDLFKAWTQEVLPQLLVDHLTTAEMVAWRDTYLKPYRDALAHRIPPPPIYRRLTRSTRRAHSRKLKTESWRQWRRPTGTRLLPYRKRPAKCTGWVSDRAVVRNAGRTYPAAPPDTCRFHNHHRLATSSHSLASCLAPQSSAPARPCS